jgi:hypothetical protein
LDVNVTGCRHAKFYQELGEPELGEFRFKLKQWRPIVHGGKGRA